MVSYTLYKKLDNATSFVINVEVYFKYNIHDVLENIQQFNIHQKMNMPLVPLNHDMFLAFDYSGNTV